MASEIPIESATHKGWTRISHWVITCSFLALLFSGIVILMCHPRLYWGEVGNDLTPALLEFPISKNYQHGGWENRTSFFETANSPESASRTFEIFNQNGWGRSLHFLSAWFLVVPGLLYLIIAFSSGHVRRHLWLKKGEFKFKLFWSDFINHLRMEIPSSSGGPRYGLLQKSAYLVVVFLLLPLMIVTGFTMSPAITAAYPFLLKLFGGVQSARTIHFFASVSLVIFLFIHLVMIIKTGFKKQMRAMTIGK